MKTITKKTAKNGATLYYIDGKRASRADAMYWQRQNESERKYLARIEAEKTFSDAMSEVNTSADAIDAAVEAKIDETADYDDKRFSATISYKIKERDGYLLKTNHARFATAADAAYHIIAFVAVHPDYIYQDGKIADWNTDNDYRITADDMKAATFDTTEDTAGNVEVSEEIAEINAADVKINVADDGKIIEQIKVDVDTAINIINRLNYRNDIFVYRHTTRYDNADIQCRHFDAYKADGDKDAFAIIEYVIGGKLEIVRFFNHFRNIIVDLQIGNVNYTLGDKGAIVLTAAEEIADKVVTFYPNAAPKPFSGNLFGYDEYHSVKKYISALQFWQDVIIIERLFKNADGTYSYDGWGRKTYYMTDCYREAYYVACDTKNVCLDAEDTARLIYVEQQLKNIVNGSDGSDDDPDEDIFNLLPDPKKFVTVDWVDEPEEIKAKDAVTYLSEWLKPVVRERQARLKQLDETEALTRRVPYDLIVHLRHYVLRMTDECFATASLKDSLEYAILRLNRMSDKSGTINDIDNKNTPADDQQAKKEMAHKITTDLNEHNDKRLQAGFKPIIPYASRNAHYHKLHGAAKWTVAYDSVNDTFGIWSEYGWHESGFSLGHEFCGWYKIAGLAVIISQLTNAIDYAQSEFYFETDLALLKRTRLCYGKWRQIQAAHLKDKINRDAQASEEIAAE